MNHSSLLRSAGFALVLAAVSGVAAQAAAPNLVSASPGPKDGYGPWPSQIRLAFDQPVSQMGLQVSLLDPDGRRIPLATPSHSAGGVTIRTDLKDPPVAGPYLVSWQARSSSGEEAKGDYTFFVR